MKVPTSLKPPALRDSSMESFIQIIAVTHARKALDVSVKPNCSMSIYTTKHKKMDMPVLMVRKPIGLAFSITQTCSSRHSSVRFAFFEEYPEPLLQSTHVSLFSLFDYCVINEPERNVFLHKCENCILFIGIEIVVL